MRHTIRYTLHFREPVEAWAVEEEVQRGARACPDYRWCAWNRRDANQYHYRTVPVMMRLRADTLEQAHAAAEHVLAAYADAPDVRAVLSDVSTTLPKRGK